MTNARDPYQVLGVRREATIRQIRVAYVERARKAHPDLVGESGLEVMRALNEAWAMLKDPGRRASVDASRPAHAAPPQKPKSDPSRPHWTGAAGPPPGRPWGHVLDFGIYDRWSLGEIARRDRGYLQWLRDRPEAKGFRAEIDTLLEPPTGDAPEGRSGRRR
jgi:curved DNA-binding protein CbpA